MVSTASRLRSLLPEAHRELSDALAALPHGRLACQETDPFGTADEKRELIAEGCPVCPVLELCIEAGIGERDGVWGGYDRSPKPKPATKRTPKSSKGRSKARTRKIPAPTTNQSNN